ATTTGAFHCLYDGNGNVTSVRNWAGAVQAGYEYGPFGETLAAAGGYAANNPWRFSTRYADVETGLVYYGKRYANSSTGRWLNRDQIGEDGSYNLYVFNLNIPTVLVDPVGNRPIEFAFDAFINDRLGVWLDEPFGWTNGNRFQFRTDERDRKSVV